MTLGSESKHYRIAPGVELVPVDEDRYTLRSAFDAVEFSGDAAKDFAESDRLRDAISDAGWTVIDGKDGQTLKPK